MSHALSFMSARSNTGHYRPDKKISARCSILTPTGWVRKIGQGSKFNLGHLQDEPVLQCDLSALARISKWASQARIGVWNYTELNLSRQPPSWPSPKHQEVDYALYRCGSTQDQLCRLLP